MPGGNAFTNSLLLRLSCIDVLVNCLTAGYSSTFSLMNGACSIALKVFALDADNERSKFHGFSRFMMNTSMHLIALISKYSVFVGELT